MTRGSDNQPKQPRARTADGTFRRRPEPSRDGPSRVVRHPSVKSTGSRSNRVPINCRVPVRPGIPPPSPSQTPFASQLLRQGARATATPYCVGSRWVGGPKTASSKSQTADPPLAAGMMLPSKTKMGPVDPSSGRQKPFAGQWKPVLAIRPKPLPETLRRVLIFFTARSN